MNRAVLYIIFILIISSCGQRDKSLENNNTQTLFEEIKPIQTELNPNIKIKLSKFVKDM